MAKRKHVLTLLKMAKEQFQEEFLILAVPGFLTKKFRGYCSIREDLLLASEYVDRIKIQEDSILRSSLNFALIAIYGKCFTDASQYKSPKLERGIFGNSNHLETHDYLMELRHKFIAHRGDTDHEVGIAIMLFEKQGHKTRMQYKQRKRLSLSEENLSATKILLNFLVTHVEQKISETGQKAHDAFLSMFSAEQLSSMSINNMKDD